MSFSKDLKRKVLDFYLTTNCLNYFPYFYVICLYRSSQQRPEPIYWKFYKSNMNKISIVWWKMEWMEIKILSEQIIGNFEWNRSREMHLELYGILDLFLIVTGNFTIYRGRWTFCLRPSYSTTLWIFGCFSLISRNLFFLWQFGKWEKFSLFFQSNHHDDLSPNFHWNQV